MQQATLGQSIQTVRAFLAFEAATFVLAALTHFGVLLEGYRHQTAGTAESVIAVVLLVGLALTWSPAIARLAGIVAQALAIFGVLVGLFFIAVGLGPQSTLDVVYHVAILAVLVVGLVIATRVTGP